MYTISLILVLGPISVLPVLYNTSKYQQDRLFLNYENGLELQKIRISILLKMEAVYNVHCK